MAYSYKTQSYLAYARAVDFSNAVAVMECSSVHLMIPQIVNAAFCCELILKATVIMEKKHPVVFKEHKSGFQIFDYCGNFEYFGEHPDGKDGKEMLTLSQRLFQIRLDMLFELQKLEYQEDAWFHAYYDQIKTELHGMVVKIKSHSNRIQVREAMQYVDKYYNLADMVNTEPFNNYDLNEIFGLNLPAMITVVRMLHEVVQAA